MSELDIHRKNQGKICNRTLSRKVTWGGLDLLEEVFSIQANFHRINFGNFWTTALLHISYDNLLHISYDNFYTPKAHFEARHIPACERSLFD